MATASLPCLDLHKSKQNWIMLAVEGRLFGNLRITNLETEKKKEEIFDKSMSRELPGYVHGVHFEWVFIFLIITNTYLKQGSTQ